VQVIAESAAYHREVQRFLFTAEPARRVSQDTLESLQVAPTDSSAIRRSR
jgi:hypothetical protein